MTLSHGERVSLDVACGLVSHNAGRGRGAVGRYRLLFNTLLDGQADVDQAMVQDDSEFRGTQRLGLLYQDAGGKLAAVGCELLIEQHCQMADGRLLAMLRGVERFRVERVVGEAPFLVCAVTPLQDADAEADADALVSLANDVRALFASTVAASAKMQGSEGSEQPAPMDDAMDPQSVSFWVASMFTGGDEQQQLLEMDSTRARLEREREVLQATLDYLTASAAIRGAFSKEG